jgi:hypothetical protein
MKADTDASAPAVAGQVDRHVRPDPERAAFEAWAAKRWGREAHRHTSATSGEWEAWQAGAAAEREQCAKHCDKTAAMLRKHGYQQAAASVATLADDFRGLTFELRRPARRYRSNDDH